MRTPRDLKATGARDSFLVQTRTSGDRSGDSWLISHVATLFYDIYDIYDINDINDKMSLMTLVKYNYDIFNINVADPNARHLFFVFFIKNSRAGML